MIARPRLSSILDTCAVIEVLAPAGYGKTTLLAAWATASDRSVAWLTLTEADADPVRFVRDLMSAFRSAEHPTPVALAELEEPSFEADLSVFVAALHRAASTSPDPLTLVVDDLHTVAEAPGTMQLLTAFVLECPEQLTVMLAGRHEPGLHLAWQRPEQRLVTIDEADLAFTPAETEAAIRRVHGAFEGPDARELHASTGGWPVAVRLSLLAAASGKQSPPIEPARINDLTQYLVSEVLDTLEPELRAFVVDASIDDSVCASLLDGIRGRVDSAQLLQSCHEREIFLTFDSGVSPDESWHRWHQLFITHVRRIAGQEDPARQRTMHSRAAEWWRSVDAVVAVMHALRAGRTELGGELAADVWPELMLAGMTDTVLDFARDLPAGHAREAELHLAVAFVEANRGDDVRARHALRSAHTVANRLSEPDRARFDAREVSLHLLFPLTREYPLQQAVARGLERLRRLEDGPWMADPVTLMLTRLCVGIGEGRLRQDNEHALAMLRSAAAIAKERRFAAVHLVATAETCLPLMATDNLDVAATVAQEVIARTQLNGWGPPRALATAVLFQGWYAYWRGQLIESRTQLSRAIGLLHGTDPDRICLATYFRALASLRAGDLAAADAGLRAVRVITREGAVAPYWPSLESTLDAELRLARGERSRARQLVAARAPGRQHPLATAARAHVMVRLGEPAAALAVLGEIDPAETYAQVKTQVLCTRAFALWRSGAMEQARQVLDDALGVAEPHGLILPFLEDGAEMRPMLHDLEPDCAHPDVLKRVLERLDEAERDAAPRGELLTSREMSILRYLQTNLTLAEIAAAEYVSINTVKTHAGSIYRKLEVGGRRDAVRVAVELGTL